MPTRRYHHRMPATNTIDVLVLSYLAWGLWKGLRRGAGPELSAVIRLAFLIALLVGVQVLTVLREGMDALADSLPATSGVLGGLLALAGSLWVVHALRYRLADAVESRLHPRSSRTVGSAFGALRTLMASVALLVALAHVPLDLVREPVTEGSALGRGVGLVLGW